MMVVFNRDLSPEDLPDFERGFDFDYYPLPVEQEQEQEQEEDGHNEEDISTAEGTKRKRNQVVANSLMDMRQRALVPGLFLVCNVTLVGNVIECMCVCVILLCMCLCAMRY